MTDSPNFNQDLTSPPRKRRNDKADSSPRTEQMLQEILNKLGEMKEKQEIQERKLEKLAEVNEVQNQKLENLQENAREMRKELAEIREKQEIQEKKLKKLEVSNEVQNQMLHHFVDESIMKKSFFYWNWLPIELRAHCVKQMDFTTRTKLRCSSKSELQLVDSTRLSFEQVTICLHSKDFEIRVDNGESHRCELPSHGEYAEQHPLEASVIKEQFEKALNLMKQVLTANIDYLELLLERPYLDDPEKIIITDIIKQGPDLKIKKLEVSVDQEFSIGLEIMKRCSMDVLTETQIYGVEGEEHFEELLRLPQVTNVLKLRFDPWDETFVKRIVIHFLEKWIHDDFPVGKQLQICGEFDFSMDEILEPWKLTIIRRLYSKKAVLLKTSDPAKHIWLHINPIKNFIVMLIVSAGSEEPDFEKMHDDFREEE